MFNPKMYERAREIVNRGDKTELVTRVYRQIAAETELNRISKAQSNNACSGLASTSAPKCICNMEDGIHDWKCPARPANR